MKTTRRWERETMRRWDEKRENHIKTKLKLEYSSPFIGEKVNLLAEWVAVQESEHSSRWMAMTLKRESCGSSLVDAASIE
jgi:hypothetical protein